MSFEKSRDPNIDKDFQEDHNIKNITSNNSRNNGSHNSTTATNKNENQGEKDEATTSSSSEAAGVARGAARTASTISRRSLVGRLPKSASKSTAKATATATTTGGSAISSSSRTAAATASSTTGRAVLPKKVPVKHVARVSDRISAGLDAYDAAVSSTSATTSTSTATTTNSSSELNSNHVGTHAQIATDGRTVHAPQKWKSYVWNALSFAKTLVKNTILGTAVFQMYEETIVYLDQCNFKLRNPNGRMSAMDNDDTKIADAYTRTMVSQHFVAGLVAGSVHSMLHMSFQSVEYLQQHHHRRNLASTKTMYIPSFPSSLASWSMRLTFHHAVAHATLFSTYEGTKRFLLGGIGRKNFIVGKDILDQKEENENENTLQYVLTIGLAGGIAGQMQHIVSHYTEAWLQVSENDSPWTHSGQKLRDILFAYDWKLWRKNGPSLRSTLMAFPPSAIGFIAFEFGKMLMD